MLLAPDNRRLQQIAREVQNEHQDNDDEPLLCNNSENAESTFLIFDLPTDTTPYPDGLTSSVTPIAFTRRQQVVSCTVLLVNPSLITRTFSHSRNNITQSREDAIQTADVGDSRRHTTSRHAPKAITEDTQLP